MPDTDKRADGKRTTHSSRETREIVMTLLSFRLNRIHRAILQRDNAVRFREHTDEATYYDITTN